MLFLRYYQLNRSQPSLHSMIVPNQTNKWPRQFVLAFFFRIASHQLKNQYKLLFNRWFACIHFLIVLTFKNRTNDDDLCESRVKISTSPSQCAHKDVMKNKTSMLFVDFLFRKSKRNIDDELIKILMIG